jgi:putative hydrolase
MRKPPPRFVRFRELDRRAVNVEFQIHTTRTDGQARVEDLLEAARARRLSAIAFTEHVRQDTAWFADFAREVRGAAQAFPELEVFVGCEAKALDADGSLDASEAVLAECDLVLGSVHRFPDGKGGLLDPGSLDAGTCAETECALALGLLRHAPIHVLAHPGGMSLRRSGTFPDPLFRRLLRASLERGIAVEINTSYLTDVGAFLELCAESNPHVSVGSDVHRLEELGRCRDTLLGQLEARL